MVRVCVEVEGMEEEIKVELRYALTKKDLTNDELGRRKHLPLSEALKITERMLRGSYVMVKLVKEVR